MWQNQICTGVPTLSWWRGTVVKRRSVTGELSLSCARPAADGWPLMWVSRNPTLGNRVWATFTFYRRQVSKNPWPAGAGVCRSRLTGCIIGYTGLGSRPYTRNPPPLLLLATIDLPCLDNRPTWATLSIALPRTSLLYRCTPLERPESACKSRTNCLYVSSARFLSHLHAAVGLHI